MTYTVHNDMPCWLKPRRTVWFICQDGKEIKKKNGARYWFRSHKQAQRAADRRKGKT